MATLPQILQGIQSQAAKVINPLVSGISNFQNNLNQNYQNDPNNLGKLLPGNQTSKPMGVPATAPEQNIQPKQTTLPPSQVKTTVTKPVQALPAMATTNKTVAPQAPKPLNTVGLQEAYNRQQKGQANAADLANLKYAQSKGWKPVTATVTTASSTPTTPSTDITSKGLLTSLATAAQTGSPVAAQSEIGLLNTAQENPATSGQAYQDLQSAKDKLAELDMQYAQQKAELSNAPISLEFKQGREQVLDQEYSAQRAALATAVNTAQSAVAQQIQGVQAQQAGFNQAGTLGQTGQNILQSGLGTAAGYAQPEQVPYGTPLVNPQTGEVLGGGGTTSQGVSPSSPFYATMQSYAKLLASNQGSAIPASVTGNPVLNAQLIEMAKKINPNLNLNVAAGTAAAQTQNAQVGGTTPVTANASIYSQALNDYYNLQQATSNVDQFGTTLLSGMVDGQGNQINPSDVKWANQSIANVRNQLSSQQQAQFDSTFAALKSKVSGLLAMGGSEIPSQITSDANKILDGSAPIGTLSATLSRIQTEGNILLQNQANKVNQARQGTLTDTASNGSQVTNAGTNGGSTIQAGGYNFALINGKWVAQ